MTQYRRIVQKLDRFFPWGLLIGVGLFLVFGGGWADITEGRKHRKAHELFSGISPTSVTVFAIGDAEKELLGKTFTVDGIQVYPVVSSVTLRGDELSMFMDIWRRQAPFDAASALCHSPPFGFRFFNGNRVIVETTVCWACSNFTVARYPFDADYCGFHASSPDAKALLEFCRSRVPPKTIQP